MRGVLSSLIGEAPNGEYNPNKYRLYGAAPVKPAAPEPDIQESQEPNPLPPPQLLPPPLDLDEGTQTGGLGAPPPTQFGAWILPQGYVDLDGGLRQTVTDRSATAAKSQIAVLEASAGPRATLAPYDEKSFRTPFEVTKDVICTGSFVNTYTQEVAETFENAMPVPDRWGGDPEREWKNATLRLQAAQGFEPRKLIKKEIEQPLPAADSGPIMANASFRQMQAVAQESDERCSRDRYFLRNDLVPTEPMMTKNPFGYQGFQNMIRVNPYMPVTQELDNKAWMANSQELPTTARFLETETRLHRDALAGRAGLAEGGAGFEDQVLPANVRVSQTQRNTANTKDCGRAAVYGSGAPAVASAESVARTLRGFSVSNSKGNVSGNNLGGGAADVPGQFDHRETERLEGSADVHSIGGAHEQRTGGRTAALDRKSPNSVSGIVQGRPDSSLAAPNSERGRVSTKTAPVRNVYGSAGPRGGDVQGGPVLQGSRATVASAEECRKSLGCSLTAPTGMIINGEHKGVSNASTSEGTRKGPQKSDAPSRAVMSQSKVDAFAAASGSHYLRNDAPVRRRSGAADSMPEGAAAASANYLSTDRQLEGTVVGTWLPDGDKVFHAPGGQKFLSDKRGIVVADRAPGGYEKVGGDTVSYRRAPAPERPPQEEERHAIRQGQPDAVESQRAFSGQNVRKVRERGPTPRRGGAEIIRGGLGRLTDHPETRSG